MKKLANYFSVIGLLCLLQSCVEEVDVVNPQKPVTPDVEAGAGQVAFIIEDFIPETQTKSAFDASTMDFRWSSDDVIGIFPEDGWQTQFNIEDGAGSNVAVFDGGSWGLKQDATYYAYYPFSKANFESMDTREAVPYSYDGHEVCFADANGIVDLSKYDFMATGASTVENGTVSFNFKHLGALCRIRFDSPTDATYTHFIISSDDAIFPISGEYDATDFDNDGVVAFKENSVKSKSLKIQFPSNTSFSKSEKVEFYFLMPPVNLQNQSVRLELVDTDHYYYYSDIESKMIQAGQSYGWDVTFNLYTNIDLEPANCYIISEAGTYSFPPIKGNGISYIAGVESAEVLWESFGTDVVPQKGNLISEVSYTDKCITYRTAEDFREGNAVIAVKDKDGDIIWSWHIWMTDKPNDQIYANDAGTMLDRNLGATSNVPGDVGALGLMYQWGRKDPFLSSCSVSGNAKAASANTLSWNTTSSTESSGTIDYVNAHPTTFITVGNFNDWYYEGVRRNTTRWQRDKKTIYDPCPSGYRLPNGSSYAIWEDAFYTNYFAEKAAFNLGYDFAKGEMNHYLTEDTSCWYPAAGYLDENDGLLKENGVEGYYWTGWAKEYSLVYRLSFDSYSVHPGGNGVSCAEGCPVRCQKE